MIELGSKKTKNKKRQKIKQFCLRAVHITKCTKDLLASDSTLTFQEYNSDDEYVIEYLKCRQAELNAVETTYLIFPPRDDLEDISESSVTVNSTSDLNIKRNVSDDYSIK